MGYEDDEQEKEEFELNQYMECGQYKFENQDERRKLEEEEEVEYFLGPYCASNGAAIHLGLFYDDTCTNFADDDGGNDVFYSMTGEYIPYGSSDKSIVGMECISCKEPDEIKEDDGNDDEEEEEEEKEPIEFCEDIYQKAGKCEVYLGSDNPNTNACTYMEGIKVVRTNGVVKSIVNAGNKTAGVFIGIFVATFFLLGGYVFYLRSKLSRASINLSE